MSDATVVDAPAAPVRPNLTPAQMIEKYLALRDKKAALEAEHKKIIAPYNLVLGQLENFLLDDLNNAGGNSLATDAGTCYRTTVTKGFNLVVPTGKPSRDGPRRRIDASNEEDDMAEATTAATSTVVIGCG